MRKSLSFIAIFLITVLMFFGCTKKNPTENDINTPQVTTSEVTDVLQTTALCGGTVTSNEGTAITARGVCWSINETPEVTDNKTTDSTGTGSFTSEISGLNANTTYYVRAYATNSEGTGYGDIISFTTVSTTLTDIDGNTYQTIQIGNQIWMAENLQVTHYRNGDAIPNVTIASEWVYFSSAAYCAYDNNESNADTYGYLYNWYVVYDSRNIAPEGWHVPTDEEWKELEMYLGMSQSEADDTGWRGTIGGKLRESGTTHWDSPNTGATNESGFSALPGGIRDYFDGSFNCMGYYATFWSATAVSADYDAWYRGLDEDTTGNICRDYFCRRYGFSVRLVRD